MADLTNIPKPKSITGGCLCGSVRYKATFPDDHDWATNSGTCQCTQCRKNTGALFYMSHHVPNAKDHFNLTSKDTLKEYSASEDNYRGFCSKCGSFLYWRAGSSKGISFMVGSIDALYMFGEGAGEGNDVPPGGYGAALCNGGGEHSFVANEIKGVTDNIPLLFKGKRVAEM